ncbi:MAG: nucleotide exchange factor GrpE [Oscillospiraceae bacterium]|nr:nucleotide exchange factor GrpE [Oscillospiraceae bacterium]
MDETKNIPETEEVTEETAAEQAAEETAAEPDETEVLRKQLADEHDAHLRLAAEYDNFRKRTQKERESLYTDAKADTIGKFLPVFDNLQRAMAQPTQDEAYKKGVEMTVQGLESILETLGVKSFGEVGETFDPNLHNAVMHKDDESLGESVICEVFQTGFKVGEKVIRHAMVVVAN